MCHSFKYQPLNKLSRFFSGNFYDIISCHVFQSILHDKGFSITSYPITQSDWSSWPETCWNFPAFIVMDMQKSLRNYEGSGLWKCLRNILPSYTTIYVYFIEIKFVDKFIFRGRWVAIKVCHRLLLGWLS